MLASGVECSLLPIPLVQATCLVLVVVHIDLAMSDTQSPSRSSRRHALHYDQAAWTPALGSISDEPPNDHDPRLAPRLFSSFLHPAPLLIHLSSYSSHAAH